MVLSRWLLTLVTATAIAMGFVIIAVCTEYSPCVLPISLLHTGEAGCEVWGALRFSHLGELDQEPHCPLHSLFHFQIID